MTDPYLQSLGFTPLYQAPRGQRPAFGQAWRYEHSCPALDGASLFIEHPFGIARCRLSTQPAPLTATEVLADLDLADQTGLEAGISAFYLAHGGAGPRRSAVPSDLFRPQRRQL